MPDQLAPGAPLLQWPAGLTRVPFQAYRDTVKDFPFYNTTLVIFGTTWLEK